MIYIKKKSLVFVHPHICTDVVTVKVQYVNGVPICGVLKDLLGGHVCVEESDGLWDEASPETVLTIRLWKCLTFSVGGV